MLSFPHRFRFPLFWQILLAIFALLAFSLGTFAFWAQSNLNTVLQTQADAYANTLGLQIANSSAEPLMADDAFALNVMLDGITQKHESIRSLVILNNRGELVSESNTDAGEDDAHKQYTQAIRFHDVVAGTLLMEVDLSIITQSLHQLATMVTIMASVLVLLAFVLAVVFAKRTAKPLIKLQHAANDIANGKLNITLPRASHDEVGDLVRSMETMVQGLKDKEAIEHKFSSYISKDIASSILSDLSQHKQPLTTTEGSVLFIDLVGFTQFCDVNSADEIAEVLNQYYFLAHMAAKMYRGSVDNFIGDGAMLTFGVHKDDSKHAINAICSAQIFIRLIDMMNAQRVEQGKSQINVRLGIHCGELLAGTIGDQERMHFSISGDTVNLASRLCDHADNNRVMISESVMQHSSTKDVLYTDEAKVITVKGKKAPIQAYQISHLAPKFNRLLQQQEMEMEALQAHE